jgi:hypothetical protein
MRARTHTHTHTNTHGKYQCVKKGQERAFDKCQRERKGGCILLAEDEGKITSTGTSALLSSDRKKCLSTLVSDPDVVTALGSFPSFPFMVAG